MLLTKFTHQLAFIGLVVAISHFHEVFSLWTELDA
jgi:hypothetical protein